MDPTQRAIYRYLRGLAREYTALQDERTFLMTGVQARLDAVNSERTAILAEATIQLDRLNALRVAAGEAPLTLQQIRDADAPRPRSTT